MSDMPAPLTLSMLVTQREGLRMLLLTLPFIDAAYRNDVKAGAMQALGAIEDALGYERTYPKRNERRREREQQNVEKSI